jgi:arylsulfatase A-like enzyme
MLKRLVIALLFTSVLWHAEAQDSRPNILVIMTDDQSHDTLTSQFMPNTQAMIADQGLTCTEFMMPTALCCPSRASFLTGKYARHDGVLTNSDQLFGPTVANHLHDSGYYTGLIGKYLNSWPGNARPEYDYWAAWISGYVNPIMNIFGTFRSVPGYLTYIQRDYALDFLNKVPANKPFFLLFTPHAPHLPAIPAPGDENLYSTLPDWRPPSFNPVSQPDKPAWLAALPLLSPQQVFSDVDTVRLNQLRCLHSVDLAVRDILLKLADQGKLNNTFIVYYSDNGYFWGEHRLTGKNRVYEEASHGPFAIRYTPLIAARQTENRLIGVIDLAPTIYELANIPIPPDVDGHSLLPLMRGTNQWRDAILLEGWPKDDQRYEAIRTSDYVYVETPGDKAELYNLKLDPYQIDNLVDDPSYIDLVAALKYRLYNEFGGTVPATLSDISTRGFVETGNNVLIGGLIVSGAESKQVILRALGPTLGQPPFNVPHALANPMIELRDSTGALIIANDDWGSAPNAQAISASGKAPPNRLESAILTSLNPGNYTVIVRGVNNTTGNALIEGYDLDRSTTASEFSNISTRSFIGTGNNVMIAGVIVRGPGSANVIVRGLGPTLSQLGVTNVLADPTLELRDASGNLISFNDNWKDTQQTQIQATGLAPPNDNESAIIATLSPGSYTAILRGNDSTTGNGLVEVYALN